MIAKGIQITALTMFGEARGEPVEGLIAVGNVIKNRVYLQFHGAKNYTDVCLAPFQFSCWNKSDPNYANLREWQKKLESGAPITNLSLRQCLFLAQGIVESYILDNSKDATHYLTNDLYKSDQSPAWAKLGKVVKTIGQHTFIIAD